MRTDWPTVIGLAELATATDETLIDHPGRDHHNACPACGRTAAGTTNGATLASLAHAASSDATATRTRRFTIVQTTQPDANGVREAPPGDTRR